MFKTLFLEEVHPSLASMMISFTHEHAVQILMTNGIMTQDVLLLMDQVHSITITLKIENSGYIQYFIIIYNCTLIKTFFLAFKGTVMS